ncbi:hypothetical protein EW146_g8789 [Bondarzewia mesenterica]|uniref:Cytochrome P450 n=1 Tax=Bondarzewia mesenterica TaxID=1095465 RepID=A0A4S4LBU0_9AGAM|nr:hypothetical protein EW146_g8789 [Bondarzewia mesenterica]
MESSRTSTFLFRRCGSMLPGLLPLHALLDVSRSRDQEWKPLLRLGRLLVGYQFSILSADFLTVVGLVASSPFSFVTRSGLAKKDSAWAERFGEVTYLRAWTQSIIFLNSREAVSDLLDKQGAIYSDRPRSVMAGELRQRRLFLSAFGAQHVMAYHPLIEHETTSFLRRLVRNPVDYLGSIRRYAGGLTLQTVYGYEATSNQDRYLLLAEECLAILANHIAPSGKVWMVDIFPILKFIPRWMPGASFKRNALKWKAKVEEFVDGPYNYIKASVRSGTAVPCFCSTILDERSNEAFDELFEFDLKWTANSMYAASADTTVATVCHFILAMILHPDVLTKAQKEIDSIIGTHRLPTLRDRADLPYVNAVVKETLRWAVPVPLGLPHSLMKDDFYHDMFIPKKSLVFANIWTILRDEKLFPQPDKFMPERFVDAPKDLLEQIDPNNYVFGFGRRICPGMHLIDSSIWLLIACMSASVDISKAEDSSGKVIEPMIKYQNSVFSIKPRSQKALDLLRDEGQAL